MDREKTILVVEEETPDARVLQASLNQAGYRVEQAFDGKEALGKFARLHPALVILDATLSGMDALQVLAEIRMRNSCPVIMLTAPGKREERLAGLKQGADDCIAKPFAPEEVVARVNAVLRRPVHLVTGEIRQYGSLKVDLQAHTVYLHGVELAHPGTFPYFFWPVIPTGLYQKQLIEEVWGLDYAGSERAVDLAVKRIRKALRNWPVTEGVKTLRGLGYQLTVHEQR